MADQTLADLYVETALAVIPLASTASDLRDWWADESYERRKYGLSEEQIMVLAEACKKHVRTLSQNPRYHVWENAE